MLIGGPRQHLLFKRAPSTKAAVQETAAQWNLQQPAVRLRVRVKARPEFGTGTAVTRILALYTAALHEAAGALNATRELGAIGGLGCGDNEGSHIDPVPYRLTATAGT